MRRNDPCALIIVSLHWGGEHTVKPVPRQRMEARCLVEAGADLLVCHHTHNLQTIGDCNWRKVYYSVGNFIFDQQKPLNSRACMVRLQVKTNDFIVETIPIEIRNCVPYIKQYLTVNS